MEYRFDKRSVFLNISLKNFLFSLLFLVITTILVSSCKPDNRWVKGNMHTHTLWSDGDDFPESVTEWYKNKGYDFLVLTDHNVILEGERWRSMPADNPALLKYIKNFGEEWVDMKPDDSKDGNRQVRLKTLDEFRAKYEEPEKFLVIMGNEISNPHAVHMVAAHQDRILPSAEGTIDERGKMIGEVIASVDEYREQSGRNIHPILAHPNFMWAITAEMMLENPSLRFFEVYNGHPYVNNEGDEFRAGTDRIWDIVLANRLSSRVGEVIYGVATDDAHNYHGGIVGPGKGWVMVNSKKLTPESILDAIDKGNFYATTGVVINDIQFKRDVLKIEIKPEEGVKYLTEFIGTRKGFDTSSFPTVDSAGIIIENTTRSYSDQIGEVFARSEDNNPSYSFKGDELYVRVRITADADQVDPTTGKVLGKQKAWVQPQILKK
jgi:hypothetical protein